MIDKFEKLQRLYQEIHRCGKCVGSTGCLMTDDSERMQREVLPESLTSHVFLVGQALARNTQRVSGIPYHQKNGVLSDTGKTLDDFLAMFGYSLNPKGALSLVYSSDIVQCYPEGNRKPTPTEINHCESWLQQELETISPGVVIVLGECAAKALLKKKEWFEDKVKFKTLKGLCGQEYVLNMSARKCSVFFVPHPSYRRRKPAEVDGIYKQVARLVNSKLS